MIFDSSSPNEDGHCYHLTFHDLTAAELTPPQGTSREVKFTSITMDTMPEDIREVRTTRFSHHERMKIGKKMIVAFGSYHRVFWNCQHFARLYLSVITDGLGAFDEWTFSQASNLFLCAFIVTTPIAITNKTMEAKKAKSILEQFPSGPGGSNDRLVLDASDEAIALAQSLVIEDYARNHPNKVRMERRGPLQEMLKTFKEVVEKGYKWIAR